MILCEGTIVRTYLLRGALILVTVGVTGCIVIDADKFELRQPAAIRTEECVIRQGLATGTPAVAADTEAVPELAGGR
jgi:hypothetical protein